MTLRKRIALLMFLLTFAFTLTGCEDEIKTGRWAGYCYNSWTGEHYWCRD